ncbi:nucleoside transporter C-terminal domain-containing protein [uncultured Algimonas sp.]|uniref:NupC/NupG family nucleoside CNT transporter n=1 Tax=uncultured Algimonas sp. TaxID=1547920 RepID=UPI00261CBDAF|nr:nucleoside transporter C-terminal domain-containing protein [uncultured Algimonas sp.]
MDHPAFGLFGVVVLFAIAVLFSSDRRSISLRIVGACFALQVAIAVLVLYIPFGQAALATAANGMSTLLSYSDAGIMMIFGPLGDPDQLGFIFFTRVLPVIIFFAALMEVLYHLRVMPFIVKWGGRFIRFVTGTRPIASLNVVANIFVGQVEAPLSLKPYLGKISRFELFTIMVSGLASIAGSVMAGYIALGISADYLIAAAFMSAPAGLMMANIFMPEPRALAAGPVEDPEPEMDKGHEREYSNVFLAAANGAQNGVQIAIAVAAMLIAFVSLIAMVNGMLGWAGGLFGADDLSLQSILGVLFAPLMWSIGVPWDEARIAGSIFGEKIVLNEFIAYLSLADVQDGLSERTQTIMTFAVCGFANFASIGILLGGLGTIIPERKPEIARMGLKAVFAASLANLMSAALAGILVGL